MAFWNLDTLHLEQFRPGILSKAEIGKDLIMVCMKIEPGRADSGHEHEFDQCGIVLEGPIEMHVGSEARLLESNDCYFIPAGERHGWKTFDSAVRLLDISRKPSETSNN
ncbi:cupin domain-containing protein [Desulfatirhabdium butyrativorans]|uniref:cupin domain-containing protein n=1 Tax=Desulfatirhabdium butyrativorans TaxID=340467 RepID=UPI00042978F9|nr:cupin domain-containing protein [Desulfatirhabdium butyrativorans]